MIYVEGSEAALQQALLGSTVWCALGLMFLRWGLTKKPLQPNPYGHDHKPISVRTARFVYLPAAILSLFFGIRGFAHIWRWRW